MATKKTSPKKAREPRTVATITVLANWTGFSRQTVHAWCKDPGFPVQPNGEWSPFDVGAWHALKTLQASEELGVDGSDSPMLEKFREERWRLSRLERREREKELVKRSFVREVFALVSSQLRLLGERINLNPSNAPMMLEDALNTIELMGKEWLDAKHLVEPVEPQE